MNSEFSENDALPQTQPTESKQSLNVIAEGLMRLSEPELQELDHMVTPRLAELLGKAFGEELLSVIGPLYLNDSNESPAQQGQPAKIDESALKAMIRSPQYWRDRDPAVIAKVTKGYKALYD
ncbi:MAG: hypothetical protein AB8B77_00995 [Alphaproteobacteria bacterium]